MDERESTHETAKKTTEIVRTEKTVARDGAGTAKAETSVHVEEDAPRQLKPDGR